MRWEYKTEIKDYFDFQGESKRLAYLNEQGGDGWEFMDMSIDGDVSITFWFKRLVDDKKDDLLK